MTDLDPAALRALGDAASRGPWRRIGTGVYSDAERSVVADMHTNVGKPDARTCDDADFVAAANPTAVLALLDRVEAQGREIERLRGAAEAELARHTKKRVTHIGGGDDICAFCQHTPIRYDDPTWPCPSVRALGAALRPSVSAPTSPDGEG